MIVCVTRSGIGPRHASTEGEAGRSLRGGWRSVAPSPPSGRRRPGATHRSPPTKARGWARSPKNDKRTPMKWQRLRLLAVGVAFGLLAGAGSPLPAQKGEKDPQAKFEPRSDPGAGQKFLERFVGDWDVVKTFYPRSGEPVRTKGECRQTMIHDGRFL